MTKPPRKKAVPAPGPSRDAVDFALADRALTQVFAASPAHLTDIVSWHAHIPFVRALIDLLTPELVVELGVHKGDSLLAMAQALAELGQPGRVVGIDTWQGDVHAGQYAGDGILADLMQRAVIHGPRVTLLRCRFEDAVPGFADGSIDLLHIDGLHTYEAVRQDFDTWRPRLSRRGVVMFHDTAVKVGDFGVHRLWDEVSDLGVSFDFPYGNGLGVLALGPDVPVPVLRLLQLLAAPDGALLRRFAAAGEALEGKSQRRVLTERLATTTRERDDDRDSFRLDIEQRDARIAAERKLAGDEISRLAAEIDAQQQQASAEIEQRDAQIAAERQLAGDEISRLTAEIDAQRQQALAEIDRLTALINDQRDKADNESARLAEAQRAIEDRLADATRSRDAEVAEVARLTALLSETTATLAVETGAMAAARDAALGEVQRAAAEADLRVAAAESALASERELARLALATLKQKADASARDLGTTRAAVTRERKRIETLKNENAVLSEALASTTTERDALVRSVADLQAAEAGLQTRLDEQSAHAASEFARLNALVDSDRASAQTELTRLNREIAILHRDYTAALQRARLKSRAVRVFKQLAFPVFRALPLPSRTKNRLRLSIVNRFGETLQLVPPKTPALTSQTQLVLRPLTHRYLGLARASTGAPARLPAASVSIIVPVYNQIEYTLRCIEAIKLNSTEIEHEIIVVDDGSSDMTEILLSPRTDITYLRNDRNLGFIGSCNAGLAQATKTYVCFLNNDTEVLPLWLSALVDSFELHPGLGLAGSQLIYPDGRLQEAGGIVWNDFSGWNWGRLQDPESPRFTYARQADYCSGAAILLPRALALAIGGFDPEFAPAYGEDSDMAFRLRAMGLATLYQPLSRVVHYEGITSGTDTSTGVKAYQVVNAEKLKQRWAHVLPHQGANGENPDSAVERGRIGRVLVIDQITPETDKDAGSITALELMLALRNLGYKVAFVPCSNFTYIPDYTDVLGALGIESVLFPWTRSVEDHLKQVGDVYDAVVIFRVNTAFETIDAIRKGAPRAKVIFHNSDLHFLREERAQAVDNPNVAERGLSAPATKGRELSVIAGSDVTIVHSHFEKALLAEYVPAVPVVVFPWVYEPRGAGAPWSERRDVVFLGGYRHYPNVDAVLHYARDVAPVLDARMHGIRFRAIGSNPTPEMTALASDTLVIEGFVDDLQPVLSNARVMLVPLRYGAGLKGKIVTAMAHGLPVVTTSIGAEGMALTHGENVLIADTPQDMAEAVVRLYTDEILWRKLSAAGLDFVAATTSRKAGLEIVAKILEHAGLPALPQSPADHAEPVHLAPVGTPESLYHAGHLAAAARRALGLDPGKGRPVVLAVPSERALQQLHRAGGDDAVTSIDRLSEWAGAAVVLVLDAFDDTATEAALAAAVDTVAAILFVPPHLQADGQGYALTHAISGTPIHEAQARTPVHLRHSAVLTGLGDKVVWSADAGITGFASLTVAVIRTV